MLFPKRRSLPGALLCASVVGAAACGSPSQPGPGIEPGPDTTRTAVPAQGTPTTLDIGNWNVDWFGATNFGPSDEALQLRNVADVMDGADLDIWGLEEVVDAGQFATLVSDLSGYAGILANDPSVVDGPAYYSDFGDTEQKVALVWRTAVATLDSARVILTAHDYDFAGRPPVEFHLSVALNGSAEDLVVIVLHAKSGSDTASRDRRDAGAQALKAYLDATYPTQHVMVIGDFNDDVDTSITSGQPSPYRYFVDDPAAYAFPTEALSDAGIASTVSYPDMIDHQLDTNEQMATYVAGSVEAFRADAYIDNYGTTTSDHYPVIARYTVASAGS
jgi:endonuclease/exonuclease/phosphatase family metal-dependent hydrolase